jgi:hypothetical protein
MKSNLQVEHQTPLQQGATIICTKKLRLKDQEDAHIKKLEDKIAKLHQNKKISQHKYKDLEDMFCKELTEKDQEMCRFKDHNKKLCTQIKKSKDTKQCIQKLEQENQYLIKKLSEKEKESSC